MTEMDKDEAIKTLKQRMLNVKPLPDEPNFAQCDDTVARFLKAYEWKLDEAEKALLDTIEYRRKNLPLRTQCQWCYAKPGYHSMRQVGHDESGRPVVYANFAQAAAPKNSLEDIVSHVTYLIENAKVTMKPGVSTWVFLIDCSGMSLGVCSPKVGLKVVNLLSAHYPERLGLIICVNHNPIFHAFWKAIKKFLAPTTASKMKMIRSEEKIRQAFSTYFPEDLAQWVWDEITLNKNKPLSPSQSQFWKSPENPEGHDPRGCPSYVENYVDAFTPEKRDAAFNNRTAADVVPPDGTADNTCSDNDSNLLCGVQQTGVHCPHPNIAVDPASGLEPPRNGTNVFVIDNDGSDNTNNDDGDTGGVSVSEGGASLELSLEINAGDDDDDDIDDELD